MKLKRKHLLISLIAAVALLTGACGTKGASEKNSSAAYSQSSSNVSVKRQHQARKKRLSYGGITRREYLKLANTSFKNNTNGIIKVDHDKSSLRPSSWKTNHVIYQKLDRLNRTSSSNTAFLERRNLANSALRVRQYIEPTGWHYNSKNGVQLYNRGHLIAYSVSAGINQAGRYSPNDISGDQNNPKNLFTQTAYSNQQLQTIYEDKVRKALKSGEKVVYQATPIFKGKDLMARGIDLQAISTNKKLDFNVFIFNVQNGYKFNYANGRAKKDNAVKVKQVKNPIIYHDQNNFRQGQRKNKYFGHSHYWHYNRYGRGKSYYQNRSYYGKWRKYSQMNEDKEKYKKFKNRMNSKLRHYQRENKFYEGQYYKYINGHYRRHYR